MRGDTGSWGGTDDTNHGDVALGVVVALIAGVTLLAACGSSGGSSAKDGGSTTTEAAKTTSLPEVTIEAADFSFKTPDTIPAGYVDVTVKNTGKEGHQVQFVKLADGVTFEQFQAAAAKTDIGSLGTSTFVGGPNGADPGESTSAIIKLDPGTYALACFIPGQDGTPHAAHGMTAEVEVEEDGRLRRDGTGHEGHDRARRLRVRAAGRLQRQRHLRRGEPGQRGARARALQDRRRQDPRRREGLHPHAAGHPAAGRAAAVHRGRGNGRAESRTRPRGWT